MQDKWYKAPDYFSKDISLNFKFTSILHKEKSKYQTIKILQTPLFGKVMLLNGFVMVTEKDEKAYHEMLVHPAMTAHPNPENILIIGGGDGGAIREILKYHVKKITMIEIDKRVIEISKKFFPGLSEGYKDKRVEIVIADAVTYVKKEKRKFDVIFVDSADPAGKGAMLTGKEFIHNTAKNLSPDIWVSQAESAFYGIKFRKKYIPVLNEFFNIVKIYQANIPSYGGGWIFAFASNTIDPLIPRREPKAKLEYYNTPLHHASFQLPEYLKIPGDN